MVVLGQEALSELCDLIINDNAVLFLGQQYQKSFGIDNTFADEINRRLCHGKSESLSYSDLWKKLSELSSSNQKEGTYNIFDDYQRESLREIGRTITRNDSLFDTMSLEWASTVTSAVDPGIENCGVDCNPIYDVNTKPAGIANKRKKYITYLFGCVSQNGSYPDAGRISKKFKENAQTMYSRVIKQTIPYSGALVIEGWNPDQDWVTANMLFYGSEFDVTFPYPKVFIFGWTKAVENALAESEYGEELLESDKLVVSEKSLIDSLKDFIEEQRQERLDEEEALKDAEILRFNRKGETFSVAIPKKALQELNPEKIHLLTAKDRIQVSFDREGIRNVTIAFLSNPNSSFPYWQGYLQGCCFDRDIYKNAEKSGLYDKVKASLSAQNLYRVPNSFILHGPSNSGKSVLLGKLALELSSEYPVLYIKGELETNDPEFSRYQYDTLVSFINEHLTRSSESDKKLRAVVIWDNNAFIDKINNYKELERELAKSNSILVGSAYELREETDVTSMFRRGVEYIEVSPLLNPDTELKSMKSMLDKNLGVGFNQAFNKAKAAHQNKSKKPNLIRDENRILSLLQRTFRVASDEYREIVEQAENRANLEASGNDELMQEQFRTAIEWASDDFDTDIKGILEILHSFDDCENEEWYKTIEACAPTINDILAISGQFGIRLPLNLVRDIVIDICPQIRAHMKELDQILARDTMLEYPFPTDESGNEMLGYRSPEEAELYLEMNYTHRPDQQDKNIELTHDENGKPYLENRSVELLEKILYFSDISDCSAMNRYKTTAAHDLVEQFGSNSRKNRSYSDHSFSRRYRMFYNRIADCILDCGGGENPEMALSASFLKREQFYDELMKCIKENRNISPELKSVLDEAAEGLEAAMKKEEQIGNSKSSCMMRLYIEWCANRNHTMNRENPGIKDLNLCRQIHDRFSNAMAIYNNPKNESQRKPFSMLDVYLNAFIYYANAMEKIYHVQSDPDNVNPEKMQEYVDEINYAMTFVIGRLLDYNDISDSRMRLNEKIKDVYGIAGISVDVIKNKARAYGTSSYVLLQARGMWIISQKTGMYESAEERLIDTYLVSDWPNRSRISMNSVIHAAKSVYEYLTEKNNLQLILSKKRIGEEKEVGALEMLIRAAWIAKTGNMPFKPDQFPNLSREDWEELHKYTKAYVDSGNERANYAFAYYLEGIYCWMFTPDAYDRAKHSRRSTEMFSRCCECRRPGEVHVENSFIYMCQPGTSVPILLEAQIKNDPQKGRFFADIQKFVVPVMARIFPYVGERGNIFVASSLDKSLKKIASQSKNITIRFNLKGALAGPEKPEIFETEEA